MKIKAEDLKCGDVFEFRDMRLCAISNHVDLRHTIANVTAIGKDIVFIQFFRTFRVNVIGNIGLKLTRYSNTEEEIYETSRIIQES